MFFKAPRIMLFWVSLPLGEVWVEGGEPEEVCCPGATCYLRWKITTKKLAQKFINVTTWLLLTKVWRQAQSLHISWHYGQVYIHVCCIQHNPMYSHEQTETIHWPIPSHLIDWAVDQVVTCVPHESPMSHFPRSWYCLSDISEGLLISFQLATLFEEC